METQKELHHVELLKKAGCSCYTPLLGYRPGKGPRCRICNTEAEETMKERWENWKAPETLEDNVKLFFEILDTTETNDSGNEFKPNYISSCRVWDSHRLDRIITKMKELTKEPRCKALGLLQGQPWLSEFNKDTWCTCEVVQGNLVCKDHL